MESDFRMLTGLIISKFGSRASFADTLGITRSALSNKLNNKTNFNPNEIRQSCELLSIAPEDIGKYFFTPLVHNCEQVTPQQDR